LRTGCNGFFYVEFLRGLPEGFACVRLSSLFNEEELIVPSACLVPIVRKQADIEEALEPARLGGRVLDLNSWVLPEDAEKVERARHLYAREGIPVPQVMPAELAAFVRHAGRTVYTSGQYARCIPDLSAVRTNTREASAGRTPRFWYMLPPFARRHRPDAFVPRVCQGIPRVEANGREPVLIDANFSTMWAESANWTGHGIRALLNSAWCRACMECLGTPLGGGALKLEATHLRRLPIPILSDEDIGFLRAESQALAPNGVQDSIDRFVIERILDQQSDSRMVELVVDLRAAAEALCRSRQRRLR
jgi:hypothetical protein